MKKLLALLLSLCMILALAACGSSGDSSTSDDTDQSNDASGDTVKIGCILALSGGSAYIGELEREGVQYCVDYYNAKGGVNGKQIEVIFADSTGTPDVAVTELERLITQEGIIAVTGPFNSSVAVAMAPICEKYSVPFVILGAATIEVLEQGYQYTFRPGNTADTNTQALIGICDTIEAKYGDKITDGAILYANGEWGVSH